MEPEKQAPVSSVSEAPPDLINSIISAVFLVVVAILTVQEKDRRHLFYVGGRQ
uniref:Uncharacterized protein n=1 Tax=Microcebus murinus TaxID=30608 RepID=A0A8C5VJH6_MICMU